MKKRIQILKKIKKKEVGIDIGSLSKIRKLESISEDEIIKEKKVYSREDLQQKKKTELIEITQLYRPLSAKRTTKKN